jgi:glycosyltransferase involved in cell wall biosynthesis
VPKVTVAMPVYNGSRFLRSAARSILDQSFADLELVIVDDGSEDDSRDIIRALAETDDRVVPVVRPHGGIAEATNAALERARGAYFAPMDQDDIAHADRLAKTIAFLDSNPDVAVVGTGWQYIDATGRVLKAIQPAATPHEIANSMHTLCAVLHPTSLMRTDVLRAIGGYRAFLPYAQDYDLWLRVMERSQLANLPDVSFSKRRHGGQVTARHSARPAQILSGAIAYLSYLSRRDFGCDAFGPGQPLVPTAIELIAKILAGSSEPGAHELHHISRFLRFAPLAGSQIGESALSLYGRYFRAVAGRRSLRELTRATYYVASCNFYNRFRHTQYLHPPFANGRSGAQEPAIVSSH